ncbi:hypothetical protein OUZ56_026174 [Daphnia magna]|uniref:Uncharacterized protein n=1 Tax=Daphnia magna TaxID=35525 RepID=A0ABQ9ZL10_9CRUS|nr:hypothetical protein OUZ56_026174 [Daphnia magna]
MSVVMWNALFINAYAMLKLFQQICLTFSIKAQAAGGVIDSVVNEQAVGANSIDKESATEMLENYSKGNQSLNATTSHQLPRQLSKKLEYVELQKPNSPGTVSRVPYIPFTFPTLTTLFPSSADRSSTDGSGFQSPFYLAFKRVNSPHSVLPNVDGKRSQHTECKFKALAE